MVSTVFTAGRRTGAYIVSEPANPQRAREQATLAAGNVLSAGTVLGRITASGKYTALNLAASDGSQTPAAILYDNVAASADARAVVSVRDMEANGHELIWPAGISAPQKIAAETTLRGLGIITRY